MEADWETCKQGHDLLYMTFECVSCYFQGKPAYSEDPLKVAASKEQVRVHYREVHEETTKNDATEDKKGDSDIVELTLEEVELFSNSLPKPVLESVTEAEAIEIGKKHTVGELTRAEYEIWAASKEKKRREALTCTFCAKIFSSDYELRRHILQIHKEMEKFECTHCEKSFCAKVSLEYHVKKVHHIGGSIKCCKCDTFFPDFNSYTVHRTLHRNITRVKCEECNASIGKEKYPRHLGEVHGIETHFDPEKVSCKKYPHQCKECDSVYKRKEDLERHERAKHLRQGHGCAECGKMFKYKTSLRRHLKADHSESDALCVNKDRRAKSTEPIESSPAEEKNTENSDHFKVQGHQEAKKMTSSKNDTTCNQCLKILGTKYSLRRHVKQMHENEGRFQCTICQKSFSAKGSLDYHSRVKHAISEDLAFRCKKCNVSFSDMKALQMHKKTHVKM